MDLIFLYSYIALRWRGTKAQQEKYMFDSIPGDLLGDIYEQYLGTILSGTEKRVKLESETGKRKKMGIYYTPSYIVDYIVKNTVGEYIREKSIDEILNVKVLDPACGSGSFLIRAFREVCNVIESKLKNGEKSEKWATFKNYSGRLNLSQKTTILINCIFGVDLDEKAVELAQLNLLLKLLDDETRETKKLLLPNMKDNIKCGNSLIDDHKIEAKAFNWQAQFPEIFKQGRFDIVIGNPPWSAKIPSELNKILAKKYSLSEKNVNICALFVLESLKKVKLRGFLGFLLPKVVIKNEAYYAVRKEILDKYQINQIVDFGQFPGVASDAVSLIVKNEKDGSDTKISFFEMDRLLNENKIKQELFKKNQSLVFSLSLNKNVQSILDKIMANSEELGELFKIKRGIELGQKSLITKCEKCGNYNEAETKYYGPSEKKCKKCGSKLDTSTQKTLQISSLVKKGIYDKKCISGSQLKRYSVLENYFIPRDLMGIDYKNEAFIGPKILIKRISTKIEGTFFEDDIFAFNTVYSVFGANTKRNYFLFVTGILNSKLIHFFYELSYNIGMNLTTQVTIDFLSKIPIKVVQEPQRQPLIKLVEEMLELQKRYHDPKIAGHEKDQLKQQITDTDYEIDEEVYKLYGITEEEKKIIGESLK